MYNLQPLEYWDIAILTASLRLVYIIKLHH